MNHSEIAPYHNVHVEFGDNNSSHSGVLWASQDSHNRDIYTFVPSGSLIAWKKAEKEKDTVKMRALESKIDIGTITWARHLS
jgi:hypothetical protein